MKLLTPVILVLSLVSTSAAIGHEFWISPQNYSIEPDENLLADLRVGSNFEGSAFAYIPKNIARFDMVRGDDVMGVEGRIGDRPALQVEGLPDGLWIVVHETTDSNLTWSTWEKFVGFVEHKDLTGTLENHIERGLPDADFRETYRRFAKSLIDVGTGTGMDREVGLRTEIIAQANPYTDDLSNGLPVLVLYEGAPRIDVQVEIFARDPAGEVTVTTTRTDTTGHALIPVEKGYEYNLDAVVMLPLDVTNAETDAAWESLWAGLSFMVPE